jgi:hypothetical protein
MDISQGPVGVRSRVGRVFQGSQCAVTAALSLRGSWHDGLIDIRLVAGWSY